MMKEFKHNEQLTFKRGAELNVFGDMIPLTGTDRFARLTIIGGKFYVSNLNMPYNGTIPITRVTYEWLINNCES